MEPELVTIAAAAMRLGVSERLIRKRLERGRLKAETLTRDGRPVAAVRLSEAARAVGRTPGPDRAGIEAGPWPDPIRIVPDPSGPESRPATELGAAPGASPLAPGTWPKAPPQGSAPAAPDPEAERLRGRVRELEAAVEELRVRSVNAEALERATARYADRLEERMAGKERELLTLARELGRTESKVAALSAPPPPRSWVRRLLGR
jgi:hypothetical protein